MADLDADGRNDLLSGSWPGEIFWFRRKANGTFAAGEPLRTATGQLNVGKASAAMASDWDGDGDLDLVVGTLEGNVFLVPNLGSANKPVFGAASPIRAAGQPVKVDSDAGPHVVDWDSDGKRDLLVGSGAGTVWWFRNAGTDGKLELAEGVPLIGGGSMEAVGTSRRSGGRSKPVAVDWNSDGLLDLVVGDFWMERGVPGSSGGNEAHGSVWVYLRKATP